MRERFRLRPAAVVAVALAAASAAGAAPAGDAATSAAPATATSEVRTPIVSAPPAPVADETPATAAAAPAQEAAPPPGGTPIVAVRIVRHDIFDTSRKETSAWPYRTANALHIMSRESFIRRLLLFRVGDPLDYARLAESERTLRSTGVMSPVFITAHPAPGGAEVVVTTTDEWTLQVGGAAGKVGKRTHASFAVLEENLFGTGRKLKLETGNDGERRENLVKFSDPLVLGTRWRFAVEHTSASDGSTDAATLNYPFYAIATPHAGGVEWLRQGAESYLYSLGEQAIAGRVDRRRVRVSAGLRLPGPADVADRLTLAVVNSDTHFGDWRWSDGRPYTTPADRVLRGFEVNWEHQRDRWKVISGFRGFTRQEDIPLGPNWRLGTFVSLPAFGGDMARVRLDAGVFVGTFAADRYSWFEASTTGRFEDGKVNNAVTSFEIATATCGRTAVRVRAAADLGHNLDLDRQLALGADFGLRGWDPGTFDGTSRAVANLELRRRLTSELLGLLVFGGEVFVDAGRSWGARIGPDSGGWRKDAGVGLLVEVTRASAVRLLRAEIAWPDNGGKPLFLITTEAMF